MKKLLKNWNGTIAVIGTDWGDSGKGRLVDDLAARADVVARFNGGSNTGHTVENDLGKFALHIVPSGIFNKNAICLVGRNVAIDLDSLEKELDDLEKAGVSFDKLILDEQASLTMPWHKLRDGLREKLRSQDNKIGTTGKGVGPTIADRTERVGLLVGDLAEPSLQEKIEEEVKIQNRFYNLNLNSEKIYRQYQNYTKRFGKLMGNTYQVLWQAKKKGKNILFEGAQGYFLDIDSGTYPFVTSTNPGVVGIWRSFDVHPSQVDQVIGITKAYTTRVGEGPMPTAIEGKDAKHIARYGHEVGTTTGRARKPGWLDLVLLKAAVEANKITSLAVTKLDVLSGLRNIKIGVGYKLSGKNVDYMPHNAKFLSEVKVEYEEIAGWDEDISDVRDFKNLPANAVNFIKRIESYCKVPVSFVSVGPKRGEVIYV